MIIVENQKEKDNFLTYWNNNESIVIPIWEDLERHPMNNGLSFLYVQILDMDFIIPFNHNDCEKIEIDLSQSTQTKWIWNKKGFLQTNIQIQNLKDVQTALYFQQNLIYPIGDKLEVLTNFYTRLGLRDDLGKSLPIMKWGEVLKGIVDEWNLSLTNDWIDNTMIPLLSDIERLGIHVDTEKFIDRWPANGKHLIDETLYTEYNPYIITSRPSNRFGGINFGALNKKDGTREVFTPKPNNIFLQFDYDAYHVRIIGKLIKYTLPTTSVHQWLADQYGCDYSESKGRTFRILYGGVSEEDKEIPFFNEVDKFIEKMGNDSISKGYIQTPKGRRIPIDWIENPNPQKLFNYLLQATETEFNIEAMVRLKEKGLPLPILYTYDSFLYDYPMDSDISLAKEIKSVLESFGFPIKASWGGDYSKV
jgi:hypothetical protein